MFRAQVNLLESTTPDDVRGQRDTQYNGRSIPNLSDVISSPALRRELTGRRVGDDRAGVIPARRGCLHLLHAPEDHVRTANVDLPHDPVVGGGAGSIVSKTDGVQRVLVSY
jgi:hypothetical protein